MEQIEKILVEIQRLKKELDGYAASEGLDYIESYINLIEREYSIPSNLEEAADEYEKRVIEETKCHHNALTYAEGYEDALLLIPGAFIAGAKWQKEQMFNNAIEGSITSANGVFGYDVAAFKFDDDHKYTILLSHKEGRKYGDKVRIAIVNEE